MHLVPHGPPTQGDITPSASPPPGTPSPPTTNTAATIADSALLALFHRQTRIANPAGEEGPGVVYDTDGPVVRRYPDQPGTSYCMVECPEGLGDDPDHWISRQVRFFTQRREKVEWKTYSYDAPADLGERLAAAGFVPEEQETLLLGDVGELIHDVDLPATVRVRVVSSDADLARIGQLMTSIWGPGPHTESLASELRERPDTLEVVVAEESADGPVLCAGWVRYAVGTDFASMWGGSTLPAWRHHGLYRATVAHRAALARERGYRFMRLDTSPDSRPILQRLGLRAVATTTPYVLDARPH